MPELDKQEIRSPEMQEVMSEIPGSFLRWGLFLFFGIIIAIVAVSYFINYPDIVTAPVTITTFNSPASLVARSGGKIAYLFVKNEESVAARQSVALIENTAFYKDVVIISSFIDTLKKYDNWQIKIRQYKIPRNIHLGEIQNSYASFLSAWQQYKEYLSRAYIPAKLDLLQQHILKQQEYTAELMIQKRLADEDLRLTRNSYERDSAMFRQSKYYISLSEFEKSKQSLLQKQSSNSSLRASIKSNESSTLSMKETRLDLQVQLEKELQQNDLALDESFQLLQVSVDQWKEKYLIVSPVKGKITFTTFWNENQVIKSGEVLATVIPEEQNKIIVRAMVPVSGLGKVKIGQEVNIKLSGFPYMEFGVIKGKIRSLSRVPVEGTYIADIDIINGMRSTYNMELSFISEMTGTADIITENRRLIFRFIKPLRSIMNN
jgi:multidrug efflux pump subunit AcrA (membrane-fusion protein)